jgi:hypothetical protein
MSARRRSADAGADVVRDDDLVYDAMLLRAFEDGAGRLMAVFFEPNTAAARALGSSEAPGQLEEDGSSRRFATRNARPTLMK